MAKNNKVFHDALDELGELKGRASTHHILAEDTYGEPLSKLQIAEAVAVGTIVAQHALEKEARKG